MAKGIKYRIEYDNFHGEELKIDILFEGFSGSVTAITGTGEPFVKKTEQSIGDIIKGQILESEYTISGITGDGFSLSDFTSENYGDIVFNFYKDATLIYSGVIAPFESSQELLPDGLASLSLSAETGLKQLYKQTIKNEDDSFLSGRYKLIDIIYKALRLLEVPNTFDIVSEVNTLVYIDGVRKNSTLDFFENYIDAEAFKLAPNTWMSAYETIEAILGSVYTLKLHESKWVISNFVDNTQTSKYITTYNYLGVKQSRVSTAKVTRALSSQIVLNGGTEGKLFSKSRVEIKQNIYSLVNRLLNPVFAYSSFDIVDWTNEGSFTSVEYGGDGSNSTPYYFKINGSVYSPAGGADTEYLESTAFDWNPLGSTDFSTRELAKYYDTNEKLRFNLNAVYGTGISGSRVQIVATWSDLKQISQQGTAIVLDATPAYDNVNYYYTNDGWTLNESWYLTGNDTNEEIVLTPPPVRLSSALKYKALPLATYFLETPPTVSVSIKLFRGERKKIGESTAEEDGYTYFVQYYALTSSVWTIENENVLDAGSRIFTSDANTDREAKELIEFNIYGDVAPIAFGSIFETNVSTDAIDGFKRLGGSTVTDYTLFLAKSFLRARDNRLSILNVTLFDDTTLESDLFTFESKTYRIYSHEWESKMNMHKLRLIEVAYSGSSISEVINERDFGEVVKAVDSFDSISKIKTIFATDPNFIYTPLKGLQLNPQLDGIDSFNPTGGFMNLLKEGNEDSSSLNFIDSTGAVTDYIKPDATYGFLVKAESESEAILATSNNAWMLNGNTVGSKKTIGSLDAYDVGIIRAGTEIATIKSTGIDIAGTLNISGLTANELTATDASKNLQSLDVATYPSLTEVSFVKGVTNSIQDQIDLKFNIASFTDVAVTSKLLTGLSISGTSVAATDSILVAVGKLQAQITAQLGGLIFQSTWNATTNTPTITSSTGTKGHYYIVSTAGATSIDGETDWKAKDWVVFNGATWDKVDNTDSVSSVNGELGAVSLTTDDITEGVTNLYYTDAAVRSAISESIIGIDYNNSTGIFSTTSGYGIPTTIKQGEWDTAYTLASSSWLLNGNTIGAKKTIGSLDAYDLGIVRGGTEIATVKSTGIDITGKLTSTTGLFTNEIQGQASLEGALKPTLYKSHTGIALTEDANYQKVVAYGYNYGANPIFQVAAKGYAADQTTAWDETSSIKLSVTANGRFGINVAAPLATLDVVGGGTIGNFRFGYGGTSVSYFDQDEFYLRSASGLVTNFVITNTTVQSRQPHYFYNQNATVDGYASITPGSATQSAYLGFHKAGGTRIGYIGYDNVNMNYAAEGVAIHNFNATVQALSLKVTSGSALGYVAVSDSSGSIIWTDPAALNSWAGNYNASTDTPSLSDGTGTYGDWYHVEVAGTNDFGSGNITFALGDRVIYDGAEWIKQTQNYTLNNASASVLGGIKIGSTLEIASGVANQKSGIATSGTYKSVTVDTYGRVTGGTNPTTIAGYGITDFSSLWTASMSTFIGAAPTTLDTWLELVAEIQDTDTDVTGLITSVATNASNLTALTSGLATNYVSKWNGSKYVNSSIIDYGYSISTASDFSAGSITSAGLVNISNVGGLGYIDTLNTNADLSLRGFIYATGMSSFRTPDLYIQNDNTGKVIIGTKGELSGTLEKFNVDGNIRYSGLLKPGGTAGTNKQVLSTNSTNDAFVTLDGSYISDWADKYDAADFEADWEDKLAYYISTNGNLGISTVTQTNGNFERVFEGLYLSKTDDESFFIGTDQENGQGVLRFKAYDVNEVLVQSEMSFDREDNYRPYFYDPTADSPTYKKVAWLDEIISTTPTLQKVTDESAVSTVKLKYSSGGVEVNYATIEDVKTGSGLNTVLANDNMATSKDILLKSANLGDTSIYFLNSAASIKGEITFTQSSLISTNLAISAVDALYLSSSASSVHINSAAGAIINAGADEPIYLNAYAGTGNDGEVRIGKATGFNYIVLNGIKYNFYSGLTFADGDQLIMEYSSANNAFFMNKLTTPLTTI